MRLADARPRGYHTTMDDPARHTIDEQNEQAWRESLERSLRQRAAGHRVSSADVARRLNDSIARSDEERAGTTTP